MNDAEFHLNIWGYSVIGGAEPTATMSEYGGHGAVRMWDQPHLLDRTLLNGSRPPDWMACYWVGEHIRRGHAILPGQ